MDVPPSDVADTSSLTYSANSEYISSPTTSSDEILPQSGNVPFTVVESQDTDHGTAGFSSINPGYTYDVGDMSDGTRGAADTDNLGLDAFFRRPIRLTSYVWQVGSPMYQTFNPIKLFMNQKRVANRVSNYRNMRGRIHLRFMINGSPFNRGLLIVHARPFPISDTMTRVRALIAADKVGASQMPHIYLNPTTSQGGDLILPFFWPYNAINLVGAQMDDTWEVILRDMSDLKNSLGSAACTIQVLAWMEEITLSSPTDHNISGILPQSGEEDEYGDKPISAMASTLARAAGKLTNAPIIGNYARATEMAARTMGDVANVFGFSRPVNLEPRVALETHNAGSLSNYNLPDSTVKLALDAKQEVVVDPRITGIGPQDEMHIATLAQRESFLTSFMWGEDAPAGTALSYLLVTPSQHQQFATGGTTEYHMTPSCWACVPFKYWRGSMRFRFKVIASNFHKGRVRITYDPIFSRLNDDFNVVQNHIFDIAETKDFTVQVGWSSERTYLKCYDLNNEYFSSSPLTGDNGYDNGSLRVEVFTNLTTADPTVTVESVEVLVFTSMCDDFEVAAPTTDRLATMSYFSNEVVGRSIDIEPQSGDELLGEGTQEPDIPVKDTVDAEMGGDTSPTIRLNDICFGESIVSWRQCLQRYTLHNAFKAATSGAVSSYTISNHFRNDFPLYRGLTSSGVHNSSLGTFNYTNMTIMNWIVPAYAGWRGGIRWKYMVPVMNTAFLQKTLQVTRAVTNTGWFSTETSVSGTATDSAYANLVASYAQDTWNGAHVVTNHNNNFVSVELPYYNADRFYIARRSNMSEINGITSHVLTVHAMDASDTHIMALVAAAEDFSCHFFLGVPVCWIYSNPTPV